MKLSRAGVPLILCGAILAAGCNRRPVGQAVGRVTLDGAPLSGASVVFESAQTPFAVTCNLAEDGSFEMRSAQLGGLPPGNYRVAIRPGIVGNGDAMLVGSQAARSYQPGAAIPEKYQLGETSGLTAQVTEGSNPAFEFQLRSR
jgi:hypothetical protein